MTAFPSDPLPDGPEGVVAAPARPVTRVVPKRTVLRGDQAGKLEIDVEGATSARIAARVTAGSITGNVQIRYWVGYRGPTDFTSPRTIALASGGDVALTEAELAAATLVEAFWVGTGAAGTVIEIEASVAFRVG